MTLEKVHYHSIYETTESTYKTESYQTGMTQLTTSVTRRFSSADITKSSTTKMAKTIANVALYFLIKCKEGVKKKFPTIVIQEEQSELAVS